MRIGLIRYILVAFLFCLVACNKVDITGKGISHKQANKIVATLSTQGIFATVEQSGRKSSEGYHVSVSKHDYIKAIQILDAHNLPQEENELLEKYLSNSDGFFSIGSKEIETLKANRATAAQIERLLENITNLNSAKVIVTRENSDKKKVLVAVSLQVRKEIPDLEKNVFEVVKTVYPDVLAEHVKIIISEKINPVESGDIRASKLEKFLYWNVEEGSAYSLVMAFFVFLILTGAICITIGYALSVLKFTKIKRRVQSSLRESKKKLINEKVLVSENK